MKVGIITFHRALNYGAVLQAYALQKVLDQLGIDSDIIDYRSPYIEQFYKPIKANPLHDAKTFLREVVFAPKNVKKRFKFDGFLKRYLRLSKPYYNLDDLQELNSQYDFFISGSDQVWNSKWSGFDKAFFLNFAEDKKKYSYAASFGFEKIPKDQERYYEELLKGFQKLSIRENSGKLIISELLGRNSEVSLDPTCLLKKNEWDAIAKKPKDRGYVLLYTLENDPNLNEYAESLALQNNTKVVCIVDSIKKSKPYDYRGFLSPEEFIGFFSNAGYVVTNSFHGLMFSVIFEKEFCLKYQQRKDAPNSRLSDFIREFSLENCVLSAKDIRDNLIDYTNVKMLMEKKKSESISYLRNIISSCDDEIVLPREKNMCCGCRACEQICPKHAITMLPDKEGFFYPSIDNSLCIRCGQCIKTCSFCLEKEISCFESPLNSFVGFLKINKKRVKSRSGGIFVAVSDLILKDGGVVYGVGFEKDFSVSHSRAETYVERNRFCGSKYVQSDTKSTFSQVYQDLKIGKTVLYSGTACQINGLKSYIKRCGLNNIKGQLVTMDIVCHGVVSPKIWQDNLLEMREKLGEKIITADFRDKSFGWNSHIESYVGQKKRITSSRYTDIFYSHSFLRPSCYVCPFTSTKRCADITLADAWGISKNVPEWDSSKGVSLVLVNTEIGLELIDQIKPMIEYKNIDLNLMLQPNLERPTNKPANRDLMWNDYNTFGYSYVANKCVKAQNRIKRINRFKSVIVQLLRMMHLK